MRAVTTAMSWEYFIRNRWVFLLFPALAFLIPTLLLGSFLTEEFDRNLLLSRDFIGLHFVQVLSSTAIIIFGVLWTQGNVSRFYTLPISTTTIVNYVFWIGAALVGIQVGFLLWLWNTIFKVDWPVIGPVLFSIVCWGVIQSIFRVPIRTLFGIGGTMGVVSILLFWFLTRYGQVTQSLSEKGSDPSVASRFYWFLGHAGEGQTPFRIGSQPESSYLATVEPWSIISPSEFLTASVTLVICYVLTLWRVSLARSGRPIFATVARPPSMREARLAERAFVSTPFPSPTRAWQWYDLTTRTLTVPVATLTILILSWLIAGIVAIFASPEEGLRIGFAGTLFATYVPVFVAVGIAFTSTFVEWLAQRKMRIACRDGSFGCGQSPRMSRYHYALPISTKQMTRAIVQSSVLAVALSAASIVISFALLSAWSWFSGNDPAAFSGLSAGNSTNLWKEVLGRVAYSSLLSLLWINMGFLMMTVVPKRKSSNQYLLVWIGVCVAWGAIGLTINIGMQVVPLSLVCIAFVIALAFITVESIPKGLRELRAN